MYDKPQLITFKMFSTHSLGSVYGEGESSGAEGRDRWRQRLIKTDTAMFLL